MKLIISLIAIVVFILSCGTPIQRSSTNTHIIFNKPSVGYSIDVTRIPEGWLYHFRRGDSIDCYVPLGVLPREVQALVEESLTDTCIHTDMVFPLKDKMFGKFFFMDVTFDGEPEFIVSTQGHDYLEFISYNITERKENSYGISLDYVHPMDFIFYGYYGLHGIANVDFDADATYQNDRLIEHLAVGPQFDSVNKTVTLSGYSGVGGSFEYLYKYVGDGQYQLQQEKRRESAPVYEDGYCVDVLTMERIYKPHPTVKDSMILVSETRCDL